MGWKLGPMFIKPLPLNVLKQLTQTSAASRPPIRAVLSQETVFSWLFLFQAVYFAHEDQMNTFLDDLDNLLIAPNYDGGVLHSFSEQFTKTLMLMTCKFLMLIELSHLNTQEASFASPACQSSVQAALTKWSP